MKLVITKSKFYCIKLFPLETQPVTKFQQKKLHEETSAVYKFCSYSQINEVAHS